MALHGSRLQLQCITNRFYNTSHVFPDSLLQVPYIINRFYIILHAHGSLHGLQNITNRFYITLYSSPQFTSPVTEHNKAIYIALHVFPWFTSPVTIYQSDFALCCMASCSSALRLPCITIRFCITLHVFSRFTSPVIVYNKHILHYFTGPPMVHISGYHT